MIFDPQVHVLKTSVNNSPSPCNPTKLNYVTFINACTFIRETLSNHWALIIWCHVLILPDILIRSVFIITNCIVDFIKDFKSFNHFSKHSMLSIKVIKVIPQGDKKLREMWKSPVWCTNTRGTRSALWKKLSLDFCMISIILVFKYFNAKHISVSAVIQVFCMF